MRTLLTNQDVKNIIKKIFNGNLEEHKINNNVAYVNPNSEPINITDEDTGDITQVDLATYLNVTFYTWKNRLVEKSQFSAIEEPSLSVFESWVNSLNFSMNESYALVELIDEEATVSQDIDSVSKIGRITFLMQADKTSNFDYYLAKIRNIFLGNPQDIQNSFGDIIKAYLSFGTLLYQDEPLRTQLGECIIATCNFRITYLSEALSYNDQQIEISLDGDDTYNNGQIVGNTNYLTLPITKLTWQNIFNSQAIPTQTRPDLTGFVINSLSSVKTLTFYDFNKTLSLRFNTLFWECNCLSKDGVTQMPKDVNIPVYIRVTTGGHFYVYKDVIEQMQKVISNNDFNISSITLKGYGKIEYTEPET